MRRTILALTLLALTQVGALLAGCSSDGGADENPTRDSGSAADVTSGTDVPDLPDHDTSAEVDAEPGKDSGQPQPDVPVVCETGATCDDGDPCTENDQCDGDGGCAGTAIVCDDGRDCTEDYCDATGSCAATLVEGSCLIDAVCRSAGEPPDGDPCRVCDPTRDAARWSFDDGAACDDGDLCTQVDTCAQGVCVGAGYTVCEQPGVCLTADCDPATGECAVTPAEGACDDGDLCTENDRCVDGECVGDPVDCGAGPCLAARCEPEVGCVTENLEGPCDDGDVCSIEDFCLLGECVGRFPLNCDDGNDCTEDVCHSSLGCDHLPVDNACCVNGAPACDDGDPCTEDGCDGAGNCTATPFVGPCDDGDACTEGDTCDDGGVCAGAPVDCDDGNPCTADSCDAYLGCRHEPTDGSCDDGDPCTVDDACNGTVCEGQPKDCSDGLPCTTDVCLADGTCDHEPIPAGAACDDGDACTEGETCDDAGVCAGLPRDCDDDNPCTADACDSASGCTATPIDGGCDDGDECTTDDVCIDGVCVGTPGGCGCAPDLSDAANKVTSFAIGGDGQPGSGLDVDGDPATCAPPANCSAGVDNSMGGLAGVANGPMQDALDGGSLMLAFEHVGFAADGAPFTLAIQLLDPASETCDFQAETCDYFVADSGFDPETCERLVTFDNATLTGGQLTAGGPGYSFPFEIPVQEGLVLGIEIHNARIEATATVVDGRPATLSGILAGAVPKQQLIDAVNAIPDETFDELGVTKDFVLMLLGGLITDDIDTDADGTPDAASIGVLFDAIGARLVGLGE